MSPLRRAARDQCRRVSSPPRQESAKAPLPPKPAPPRLATYDPPCCTSRTSMDHEQNLRTLSAMQPPLRKSRTEPQSPGARETLPRVTLHKDPIPKRNPHPVSSHSPRRCDVAAGITTGPHDSSHWQRLVEATSSQAQYCSQDPADVDCATPTAPLPPDLPPPRSSTQGDEDCAVSASDRNQQSQILLHIDSRAPPSQSS